MSVLTERIQYAVNVGSVSNGLDVERYKILALVAIAEAIERGASNAAALSGNSGAADGDRTFGGSQ